MQSLTKLELVAARASLRRADFELSQARAIFVTAAYVSGASVISTTRIAITYLIAQIEAEILKRP